MSRTTPASTTTRGHRRNRGSLAALLGTAVVAAAAMGVSAAPAAAKPTQACQDARTRMAQHQRWVDWAHAYSDQATLNFYRSLLFDDQIAVLDNC